MTVRWRHRCKYVFVPVVPAVRVSIIAGTACELDANIGSKLAIQAVTAAFVAK